jgi:hypothetical protein
MEGIRRDKFGFYFRKKRFNEKMVSRTYTMEFVVWNVERMRKI